MFKIKKTKILMCGLALALALSIVQLPKVYAADSCFEAVGDIVDYDHGNTLHAKIRATCEMELHSIVLSFADTEKFEGIEELAPESVHSQISGVEISDDHLHLEWNTDESAPYANVLSGEDLFSMTYQVPINTTAFKRNMPITINSVQYKIGDEIRTEENVNLDAILTVTHDGKDVIMVTGIEKQDVSYNGGPIALAGDLIVEENPAGITANDLNVKYYNAVSVVDEPTEPGDYKAVYYYEDDNYLASLSVPFTIKDYWIVNTQIWSGHGVISAPHYIDAGANLHVDITPEDGYEVVWVRYNDDDVTELLNEDNSLDIEGVNENAEIVVAFRPVYQVITGNGGTYTKGSGSNYLFAVDKDPASYTDGEVVIIVDEEPVDLNNDVVINPETKIMTILSGYLDTLTIGTHNVEIYFFDTGFGGIARATFNVVGAEEDEPVVVPDTGVFTGGNGSVEATGMIAVVGVAMVVTMLATRRFLKKTRMLNK